jgi:hypothetical protein
VTIRDEIKRRRRIGVVITIVGIVCVMSGAFFSTRAHLWLLIVAGFAILLVSTFYQTFGIRCPRCKERVGPLVAQPQMFAVTKPFHFCPFCGISLDTQLDETHKV